MKPLCHLPQPCLLSPPGALPPPLMPAPIPATCLLFLHPRTSHTSATTSGACSASALPAPPYPPPHRPITTAPLQAPCLRYPIHPRHPIGNSHTSANTSTFPASSYPHPPLKPAPQQAPYLTCLLPPTHPPLMPALALLARPATTSRPRKRSAITCVLSANKASTRG